MAVIDERSWLEDMPPVGGRGHLAQEVFGRVAVLVDGRPQVFPVNYAMDGDDATEDLREPTRSLSDAGSQLDCKGVDPS